MAISKEIIKQDLEEKYQKEIYGLGEVYEIMSVERLRKRLLKKFSSGYLYLASNKNHSGRGVALEDLESYLASKHLAIEIKGYIDSPPWRSLYQEGITKKNYNWIIIILTKIIFFFLIRLEFLWKGRKKSHMVFGLVKKQ